MQTPRFLIRIILNLFPPLLFNRIVLKEISEDFMQMKVVLKKTFFNINFHKTIFGGSVFSAFDPYFPTMYYYIFKKRKLIIWIKSAEIEYLKPATSSLKLHFKITKKDIEMVEHNLNQKGKTEIFHSIEAINQQNIVCAKARMNIYLRDEKIYKKLKFQSS